MAADFSIAIAQFWGRTSRNQHGHLLWRYGSICAFRLAREDRRPPAPIEIRRISLRMTTPAAMKPVTAWREPHPVAPRYPPAFGKRQLRPPAKHASHWFADLGRLTQSPVSWKACRHAAGGREQQIHPRRAIPDRE